MNWLLLVLRLQQAMTSLLDLDLQLERFSVSPSTEHCWYKLRLVKTPSCPRDRGFSVGQPQKVRSLPVKAVSDIFRSQLQIVQDVWSPASSTFQTSTASAAMHIIYLLKPKSL